MGHILVVDDEKGMRDFLAIMLQKEGHEVTLAASGEEALEQIQREIYDLMVTDIRMRKLSGMDLLKEVKESSPDTIVIMITAFASPETAVQAMKQGAYDYITKPFDVDAVKLTIRRAMEKRTLRKENLLLRREIKDHVVMEGIGGLVGTGSAMIRILDVVQRIADSPSSVLITGESGTGKELVARAIHQYSHRCDLPFVAINCSALPEGLLESELFGHVKGSFTGAVSNKEGLFEAAH
ncbi:MAG: sigma-54-dependent Fis family transcriptional regulator, partial [Nitrospirae bacterium]|nr:sigma-54-dependent Fis family transcriptional regulator [Nitrospirota bacterium]